MKNLFKLLLLVIASSLMFCTKKNDDPIPVTPVNPIDTTGQHKYDTTQAVKDSLLYIQLKNNTSTEYVKVIFHDTLFEIYPNNRNYSDGNCVGNGMNYSLGASLLPNSFNVFINSKKITLNEYSKLPISKLSFTVSSQGYIDYVKSNRKFITHRGADSDTSINTWVTYGLNQYNSNLGNQSGIHNIKTNDTTQSYNIIYNISPTTSPYNVNFNRIISGYCKMTIAVNNVVSQPQYDNQNIEITYRLKGSYVLDDSKDMGGIGDYQKSDGTWIYKCDTCY